MYFVPRGSLAADHFGWDGSASRPHFPDTDPLGPRFFIPPTNGTATNGKPIYNWDQAAAQIDRDNLFWGASLGSPATVTYAFRSTAPASMPDDTGGFTQFNAAQITAAMQALQLWSEVANITFVRVGSGTSGPGAYSDNATILFGNYSTGESGAAAFAYFPTPGGTAAGNIAGDVWINSSLDYNANPVFLDYGPQVLEHEIGHAIGLDHPGDYNANPNTTPTYDTDAVFWQDDRMFTVMSYFGSASTGGSLPGYSSGPQLYDIAAAQLLYGPNMTTRTGDTVYGFNSNTGEQHFSITSASQGAVFAIWDAGGNDTLDLSGYSTNSEIDLRPESFSSAGSGDPTSTISTNAIGNISIAKGVIIENAIGGSGNDTIIGNDANNSLDGGSGADVMSGGLGNDTYHVDNVGDLVTENANEGTDAIISSLNNYTLAANVENLVLAAGTLNGGGNNLDNVITGNSADNILWGGAGNDTLDGGAGADQLDGQAGNDTYIIDNVGDFVWEAPNAGTDTVISSVNNYSLRPDFENLVLAAGTLNGGGNNLDNVITGNSADNILWGGAGNDTLDGGAGADQLDGQAGNDTYIIDNVGDFVWEAPNAGTDTVISSVNNYSLRPDFENLVLAAGTLNGGGNNLDNVITGNSADNILWGGAGNDTLDGGAGADQLDGQAGNDTYIIDNVGDFVWEAPNAGTDTVISSVNNYSLRPDFENLVLAAGTLNGGGNNLDNVITGNSADNILWGGAGNDTLDGGAGADQLDGQAGNDTYIIDNVGDFVWEAPNAGTDTVRASISYTLQANFENLTLTGTGAINATGNGLDNVITGNAGVNTLTGGAGNDTFVFNAGQASGDVITDFNGNGAAAGDRLDFEGYGTAAQGATFIQIDATHWQINSADGTIHDVVTIANGASIDPSDFIFGGG